MTIQLDLGSQLVNLCAALLLLTAFAIVAQRRLSACVDLYAFQSFLLAGTAALVAFLTGMHHLYIAAGLNLVIKVVAIPSVLNRIIRRLNVKQEIDFVINIPPALLISGALVILAYDIIERKHGGKIEFASVEGQGSEVTIILPLGGAYETGQPDASQGE